MESEVAKILEKALDQGTAQLLEFVLMFLVPYALVLARSWVKTQIARVKDQHLREGIEFALDRLDKTAQTVCAELRQRYVVRDPESGRVTNADAAQRRGMNRIHMRLDLDTKQTLQRAYGDQYGAIVRGKVEQYAKG